MKELTYEDIPKIPVSEADSSFESIWKHGKGLPLIELPEHREPIDLVSSADMSKLVEKIQKEFPGVWFEGSDWLNIDVFRKTRSGFGIKLTLSCIIGLVCSHGYSLVLGEPQWEVFVDKDIHLQEVKMFVGERTTLFGGKIYDGHDFHYYFEDGDVEDHDYAPIEFVTAVNDALLEAMDIAKKITPKINDIIEEERKRM